MRCGYSRLARALCAVVLVVTLTLERQRWYATPRIRREQKGRSSSSGSTAFRTMPLEPPTTGTIELRAWNDLLVRCSAKHAGLSASRLLKKNDIPVVIMAGSRSEYLLQVLQQLDDLGRAQLVIVSYNRPKISESHPIELTKSFEVAGTMKNLIVWPIWSSQNLLTDAHGSMNRYVKVVWMETMAKVWETLHGYDGDVIFLEDDLLVSPDFFTAVDAASEVKQSSNTAVFALGGWAGQNAGSASRRPEQFMRKTWSAFPTMGYGFNRSLWRRISTARGEIINSSGLDCAQQQNYCAHNLDDWSFAVSRSLRLRYGRTKDPYLRNFQTFKEVQLVQPPVSRVWHIGKDSSIAEDVSQKSGWDVSSVPPWVGYVNHSNHSITHTLLPGYFDYDGEECRIQSVPCDLRQAILQCQTKPSGLKDSTSTLTICDDDCVGRLLACSSDPKVAKIIGLPTSTVQYVADRCSGRLSLRAGCRSWTIQ